MAKQTTANAMTAPMIANVFTRAPALAVNTPRVRSLAEPAHTHHRVARD
jgi:hypothetical protein